MGREARLLRSVPRHHLATMDVNSTASRIPFWPTRDWKFSTVASSPEPQTSSSDSERRHGSSHATSGSEMEATISLVSHPTPQFPPFLRTFLTKFQLANGRDSSSNPSYYVINGGTVAAASGESVSSGSYYLGRPWRDYARVVFQNVNLSNVINSAGWKIWSDGQSTSNIYYGEYGNSGSGASGTRVSWSKKLSSAVSMSTVLGSSYSSGLWYDGSYPN